MTMNNRILSIMILIAIVGDFAVPYILAPFYKGYSHTRSVMSSLGNPSSPVRMLYNIWLVVLGVLLLVSCKLIYIRFLSVSKGLSIALIVLVEAFAIGAGVISGLFSVNERKDVVTIASQIHGIGASVGFMLLLFAPLLLAILFFKENHRFEGGFSLVCFVAAFVFFGLFIMAEKQPFQNTIIALEGLWQRLTLLFMYLPFLGVAISELLQIR